MATRKELVEKYAADMQKHFGEAADLDLLEKVVIGLGPSVYRDDAETVATSQPDERETIKKNFLIKKLGLSESDDLDGAIGAVTERYGTSNRSKYRAVFYYMLAKHFGKESVYG